MFLTTNRVYVDCYLWSCLKITITLKYNTNKEGLKTLSLIFNGSNSTVKSLVTLKRNCKCSKQFVFSFWTLFVKSHLHNAFIQKIQMMSFWVSDKNSYGVCFVKTYTLSVFGLKSHNQQIPLEMLTFLGNSNDSQQKPDPGKDMEIPKTRQTKYLIYKILMIVNLYLIFHLKFTL